MKRNKTIYGLIIFSVLLVGCSSTNVYKEVFKGQPSYNQKEYSLSKENIYKAVLKAVLAQNFLIEKEGETQDFILAKRVFQKGKRTIVLLLQAKIIADTESTSNLYLSAMQTTERSYVADRTRFFLFILPLPGGGGKEASQIKEGEKIIEDKDFYNDFFRAIEQELSLVEEKQ